MNQIQDDVSFNQSRSKFTQDLFILSQDKVGFLELGESHLGIIYDASCIFVLLNLHYEQNRFRPFSIGLEY